MAGGGRGIARPDDLPPGWGPLVVDNGKLKVTAKQWPGPKPITRTLLLLGAAREKLAQRERG